MTEILKKPQNPESTITKVHTTYLQGDPGALSEVTVALQGQLNKLSFSGIQSTASNCIDTISAYCQKLDNAKAWEHGALA